MHEAVQIMIPAAVVLIAALILYTGRKAKRFEAQHAGVYKTNVILRGIESLLLLVFAIAALLALKGIIGPLPGIILMALLFIIWLPCQALMCTMLSLGEEGITYMNPLRGNAQIPWKDVVSISVSKGGMLIKSGDKSIRVRSYFTGLDKIEDTIKEKCPEAFK